MGRMNRTLAFLIVPLAIMVFGVACSGGGDDPDPTATPTATATASATSTEAPETNTPQPSEAATDTATPTLTPTPFVGNIQAMKIPRFDVSAAVENIGLLPNNELMVPANAHNVGWYELDGYGRPGWAENSVYSAHVDYYPNIKGPFYRLAEMEAGDEVQIVMENGATYTYEVFSNTRYDYTTIPMGEIIWPKNRPPDEEWITLITCGGAFQYYNGTSGPGYYLHRDVVVAKRVTEDNTTVAAR